MCMPSALFMGSGCWGQGVSVGASPEKARAGQFGRFTLRASTCHRRCNMLALAHTSCTTRASLPRLQHASLPGIPVRRSVTRGYRRTPVRSMAQPVFETANLLQAALPAVLRTLPSFILASVALYATTNYIQYNQIRRRVRMRLC